MCSIKDYNVTFILVTAISTCLLKEVLIWDLNFLHLEWQQIVAFRYSQYTKLTSQSSRWPTQNLTLTCVTVVMLHYVNANITEQPPVCVHQDHKSLVIAIMIEFHKRLYCVVKTKI